MIHLTASQVDAAVRKMYEGGGVTVISQVRNGTGFSREPRTADIIAISTWPSRGLFAEGIEIKVNRGDLRRELTNPKKADDIAKYCRHFWLAGPVGIDEDLMIPAAWGIITVDEKLKAKVKKQADVLKCEEMDSLFVCAVLRSFSQQHVHVDEVEPRIKAAREDGIKQERSSRRASEFQSAVEQFKQHSDIDLMKDGFSRYDIASIGQAVKLVMDLRNRPLEQLTEAREALLAGAKAIEATLGTLKLQPAEPSPLDLIRRRRKR